MIEISLAAISVTFGISLLVGNAKCRQLKEENQQLRKRLLAAQRKHRSELEETESRLNTTIGQLQMALFQRNEQISDLRARLKNKDALIRQKWTDARSE